MNFEENRDLFLEEARDILAKLEANFVELEKNTGDKALLNEIFRALHTIKGSGAMFGFQDVSDFTHYVENLFDELRKGKLAIDSSIIDIGLRSVDCITLLLVGSDGGRELKNLIRSIEDLGLGDRSTARRVQEVPVQEMDKGDSLSFVYRIGFVPHSLILHRGVRLESLFRELKSLGECTIQAMTDAVPALEALDPTSLHLSWIITLSTRESLAAVTSVFMFVEDYSDLSIQLLELENGEGRASVPRLGEILVDRGFIQPGEVKEIRAGQRLFGDAAVESGRASREEVDSALAEQTIVRGVIADQEIRQESTTIRVKKEKLDSLIDLVGELVILQSMMDQEARKEASSAFKVLAENLARLSSDLQDSIMGIRMVPLAESFASFKRLVRDLSSQLGKDLRLEISGADTELDKNVIELLKDPFVHIIRNSADHGIEAPEARRRAGKPAEGTISIAARQVGARVEITIADDGGGLDIGKIRDRAVERRILGADETNEKRIMEMIFEPGFSTAESTTSVSGRGVGMDVVKRNIDRLRGEVSLQSEPGKGMAVCISIPLTLVIIEGLLVRIAGHDYVLNLGQVQECVDLDASIALGGADGGIIDLRGESIPTISMRENLGIGGSSKGVPRLVIVTNEGARVALMVDEVLGRKQVVIKPFSGVVRHLKSIYGATILGDGSVALILDIAEIIKAKLGE